MMAGDQVAFETLYERRQAGIYRFAMRMSGSEAIAEDVTHDVFLALIRDGAQFHPERGSVAAYLYGMARHRVLRRLERDRSFVSIPPADEGDEGSGIDDRLVTREDPLAQLTRGEVIEAVRQAILALPPHYREVIVLCELQEMTYEQAAQVIDCAIGTVRSRLHRARALLVDRLRSLGEPETHARYAS
jgi:RNA polymerase sigma-70 factor (ECF subfamily)